MSAQLNFAYAHVGSPHRYAIPVLPGDFSRMTLTIPTDKYILEGTLDLLASTETEQRVITPTVLDNQFSIELAETHKAICIKLYVVVSFEYAWEFWGNWMHHIDYIWQLNEFPEIKSFHSANIIACEVAE